jgi:hypothetical protein
MVMVLSSPRPPIVVIRFVTWYVWPEVPPESQMTQFVVVKLVAGPEFGPGPVVRPAETMKMDEMMVSPFGSQADQSHV